MPAIYSEGHFTSADGESRIAYSVWEPRTAPSAVLQISHGMCEYIGRYADFAEFLVSQGIAVCGNDHIGHGRSAGRDDKLGYIPRRGGAEYLVADLYSLTELMRERFAGVPYFLLGHSMGSFVARLYLSEHGNALDGAVIMGTGGPGSPTGLAKLLAYLAGLFSHGRSRPRLINNIAFGSYLARLEKGCSPYAWISRDEAVVEKYSKDKYCSSFIFTADGFYTLFDMLGRVSSSMWAGTLPRELPLLLVSGEEDPVGGYGKGVGQVYERIKAAGVRDVTLKLYPGDRHEILNELDREQVYADLAAWLRGIIGGRTAE